MIKRIFSALIVITLSCVFTLTAHSVPDVSAGSAVVINADTYEVVYEKNAHKIRSMASTTKIMTSLLAVESGKLDEVVTVKNKLNIEGTSIGAKQGYSYRLIDLVYGMLLESGNDAAYLVATYLAKTEKDFSVLMNKKAAEIGMTNTNFVTSSGLDDEMHYTTAYDMALLGCYAVKNDIFREICSTKTKSINLVKPEISVTFSNHNRLLNSCEGVFGIKTGFTKKSGRCLVSACQRNGTTYVAVTLNASDDWNDHEKLYDYAFDNTKSYSIKPDINDSVTIYGSTQNYIKIQVDELSVPYVNKIDYSVQVLMPKIIYAPVKAGDSLGSVRVFSNGKEICRKDIYALENADSILSEKKPKISFINKIIDYFKKTDSKERQ